MVKWGLGQSYDRVVVSKKVRAYAGSVYPTFLCLVIMGTGMGLDDLISENTSDPTERGTDVEYKPDEFSERIKGFVTGLVVGEGSFFISLTRKPDRTVPYGVRTTFTLNMAEYSRETVEFLEQFFGCGNITVTQTGDSNHADKHRYRVSNIEANRGVIAPFFEEAFDDTPVDTDKEKAFNVWHEIVKRNRDGRRAHTDTEDLINVAMQAAYAKSRVNQITHGTANVTFEEVENEMTERFPEKLKDRQQLYDEVDGWMA